MNPTLRRMKEMFDDLSDDELLHLVDLAYDEIEDRSDDDQEASESNYTYLPRIRQLFDWGYVEVGDVFHVKGHDEPDKKATMVSRSKVEYEGEEMSCFAWATKITGWKSIRIYDWVIVERNGKLLGDIRKEAMNERGMDYPE